MVMVSDRDMSLEPLFWGSEGWEGLEGWRAGGLAGWELSLVLLPEQPLASSWEGLGPNWAAGQLEQLLTYNHRRQQEMSMFHKVKENNRTIMVNKLIFFILFQMKMFQITPLEMI